MPHDPAKHPTADPRKPGIRPGVLLIGGAVAVQLLSGGGTAVGIRATGAHDTTDQAVPSPASVPTQASPASTPTTPTPPPRREQCGGLLNADPAQRSVNVPAGSTACGGTAAGRVGCFAPSGAAANGRGRLEATVWELP
ncbi:hypothetical protein PUR28_15805 [Streptomyces sp. BE308]|uniref:hypothetical protein n=1 Tax=Streptomyces sp. BE308 TaxID=3002529 RepID=UPI002E790066|nr:hypothetical protein [Streptomyces sp. BE308]MEE1792218.1 hypothetical protein [Streptomyces sp. BE308]